MDVGNTNITVGVFSKEDSPDQCWRLPTDRGMTPDSLAVPLLTLLAYQGLQPTDIKGSAVCCVVPPLLPVIVQFSRRYLGRDPLVVTGTTDTGIIVRYQNPAEVGADRVVNALAAFTLFGKPLGQPCIVVDFGTATTLDVISPGGEYLGGAIAPGIGISIRALFESTAMLPRVELTIPGRVIGKNTIESIQSGIVFGYASQVDGMIHRMEKELGAKAHVIATGGLAPIIASACEAIDLIDQMLTLRGLKLIHQLKQK